jgi:hypothetical protein
MDTSEFDQRIAAAEQEISDLKTEMGTAQREIFAAFAAMAAEFFEITAESAVRGHPERAKELGVKGLKVVKNGVEALKQGSPKIVEETFGREIRWPHIDPEWDGGDRWSNPFAQYGSHRPADIFDRPMREVLGHVGQILLDHGLAKEENWRSHGRYHAGRYFPYAVSWSEGALAATKRYADLYSKLSAANGARTDARNEKASAEAQDLWDQA